jgi:hypothetical protein
MPIVSSKLAVTAQIPSQGIFQGIDRRSIQSASNPSSLYDAVNCSLDTGGGLERRDALVEFAQLPPNTHGLYALGGTLRVAVPAGHGYQAAMPPGVDADVFGDSSALPTPVDKYVRLSAVESWGADAGLGAFPYLVLETSAGQFVHHWIVSTPILPTSPALTRIDLGFDPGPSIIKIQRKFYAPDAIKGTVPFSSTQFGPGTWRESDAPGDAGFLNVIEHALSDPRIKGVTLHQGRLLVVFANSMQIWNVSPDPANISMNSVLNGPGTNQFGSLSPVIGDVFYFSEGGFRSLSTQTVTGELREGDLGAAIRAITAEFANADPQTVKSLWSQARSQYICAFNTSGTSTVFCFTLSPALQIAGWTRWTLPIGIDYITELDGVLYLRYQDMVYKMDPAIQNDTVDGVEQAIDAYFDTQFIDGGEPRWLKHWTMLDIMGDSTVDIDVFLDQKNRALKESVAVDLEGTTYDEGMIPVDVTQHAVAFRVRFKAPGSVERINTDAIVLVGSG